MNIFGFNYMMPTQAPNAIVLDGSIIIVIGFIALGYFLLKYKSHFFETDKDTYSHIIDDMNSNAVKNTDHNKNTNKIAYNINVKNENNIQEEIEEYDENINKEVNLNYR